MDFEHSQSSSDDAMSIGAVVAKVRVAYPNVTHSSLRFLQREGLITPHRTPGGHRLYGPDDVNRILQIKTWQEQRLSLDDIRIRLAHLDSLLRPPELSDRFLHQLLDRRVADAQRTVLDADDVGLSLERLFGDVIRPALMETGVLWEQEHLLVAQEKEISEAARELIAELTLRHATTPANGPSVVAACVQGERHDLGLRMICGLLRSRGYDVHFLGADVDARFLLDAVKIHSPAAVLVSAKLEPAMVTLVSTIDTLRKAELSEGASLPIIVAGGRVAIEHQAELRSRGAIPIATEQPGECVALIEAMLPVSLPAEHAGTEGG